jgi:lipocalin
MILARSLILMGFAFLTGCSITGTKQPPMKTVAHVDLPRFMGAWYVIGTIPWFVERDNVGTMDIYRMRPDGKIDITYVFHKKELSAKREEMHAVGTVVDKPLPSDRSGSRLQHHRHRPPLTRPDLDHGTEAINARK